ncbi:MAG: MFS transporter [Chloroflexota bacterium]|nr:MAG: MFS transporter [Chloroflexota bacterium]
MDELLHDEALLAGKTGPIYQVFGSLFIRNYRLLWLGNLLSSTAVWMEQVAAGWLMLLLSGSPFMVGLASFARGIPLLLVSPASGVLADRLDRRRLLITNQAILVTVALILAVLIATGWITPWQLLAGAVVSGITSAMLLPTRQTLVSSLVGRAHLTNAIALQSMGNSTTRILGPSLAGALIGVIGVMACYFVQAASYVSALCLTVSMRTPPNGRDAAGETMWQNLRAGFSYIRADRSVLSILIMASVTSVFAMPYTSMLPVLARDVFKVDASGLGILMTTMGVGSLVGSLALAAWTAPPRRGPMVLVSVLVLSLGTVALALADSYFTACVVMAVIGLANSFALALYNTLIQVLVPDALRGRVMSAYMMTFGLTPLGALVVGAIAEVGGAPLAIGLGGGISAVAAILVAIYFPELRALE